MHIYTILFLSLLCLSVSGSTIGVNYADLVSPNSAVTEPFRIDTCCVDRMPNPVEYKNCGGDRYANLPFSSRSPVYARNGMAATSQPFVTNIALDILQKGGNAVDAAIAAHAAHVVLEPDGTGLGADTYVVIYDPATQRVVGLNGSGKSPRNLSFQQLRELIGPTRQLLPGYGPLSVTVPGTVDAWQELHQRYGTLPLSELLEPAITYAEEGYPWLPVIASKMQNSYNALLNNIDDITSNGLYPNALDNFQQLYVRDGRTPVAGEVWTNPTLANTLRRLLDNGLRSFYDGQIAQEIVAYGQTVGMHLSLEDFERHTSSWVDTYNVTYRGYEIHEIGPNSQGLAVLQMLKILELFPISDIGHNTADYLHLHVAAKQLAYADRARWYADPDFNQLDYNLLLSAEYAAERAQLIDLDRAFLQLDAGNPFLNQGDTIYFTTADKNGMLVSLISSNYNLGSGLCPTGLGFCLQNRGALYSLQEASPNAYAPEKRPFHTIIPAMVLNDGKPFLSFGVMGGDTQAQAHAQILTNIIDFGMNVQEAGDAAKYYHTGSSEPTGQIMLDGGTLSLERGVCEEVREELIRRGHTVLETPPRDQAYGGYQGIMWDEENGVYIGGSDMRKDGQASGF